MSVMRNIYIYIYILSTLPTSTVCKHYSAHGNTITIVYISSRIHHTELLEIYIDGRVLPDCWPFLFRCYTSAGLFLLEKEMNINRSYCGKLLQRVLSVGKCGSYVAMWWQRGPFTANVVATWAIHR